MRILDRSSRHGEGLASGHRYERIQARETIEHIREFLAGTAEVAFSHPADESARRMFVATVLKRYRYFALSKGPRGVLFAYMQRLTGYSRHHLSRRIAQYRDTQSLRPRLAPAGPASRVFTDQPM